MVFDPVGGSLFHEALKSVTPWGSHYLVIGFAAGDIPSVPCNLLLVKNCTLHGVFWGSYLQHQPKVLLQGMERVLKDLAEGRMEVQVGQGHLISPPQIARSI